MKTALLTLVAGLLVTTAGIVGLELVPRVTEAISPTSSVEQVQYKEQNLPPKMDTLSAAREPKLFPVRKVITLEESNMVALRGPVTGSSVAKLMTDLRSKSSKLSKNTRLLILLDSPGGSVFDGLDLIDFAKGLPQHVDTVTLFAASMAFQIAQQMDKRYITPNGTLMSHRARGSVSGQFDGELESRYKMVKRAIDKLDQDASSRMGMKLSDYKKLILNEYWVHGYNAIDDKAADEQVLLRCGKSLEGTEFVTFDTLFGSVDVEFSKCPLIKAPVSVRASRTLSEKTTVFLNNFFNMAFNDQEKFVQEYIVTNKIYKVVPQ